VEEEDTRTAATMSDQMQHPSVAATELEWHFEAQHDVALVLAGGDDAEDGEVRLFLICFHPSTRKHPLAFYQMSSFLLKYHCPS
jgi:hypothetical protein